MALFMSPLRLRPAGWGASLFGDCGMRIPLFDVTLRNGYGIREKNLASERPQRQAPNRPHRPWFSTLPLGSGQPPMQVSPGKPLSHTILEMRESVKSPKVFLTFHTLTDFNGFLRAQKPNLSGVSAVRRPCFSGNKKGWIPLPCERRRHKRMRPVWPIVQNPDGTPARHRYARQLLHPPV